MSLWDHIPPDELARRTRNYGLAGGYLTAPVLEEWRAVLEAIRALPECDTGIDTDAR